MWLGLNTGSKKRFGEGTADVSLVSRSKKANLKRHPTMFRKTFPDSPFTKEENKTLLDHSGKCGVGV